MNTVLLKRHILSFVKKLQKVVTGVLIILAIIYLILYYFTSIRKLIPEAWVMFTELLGFGVEWFDPNTKLSKGIELQIKYKRMCDELYKEYNHTVIISDGNRCVAAYRLLEMRVHHIEENYVLECDNKSARPSPTALVQIEAAEQEHETARINQHVEDVRNGDVVPRRMSVTKVPTPAVATLQVIPEEGTELSEEFTVPEVHESIKVYSYTSSDEYSVVGEALPADDGSFPPL